MKFSTVSLSIIGAISTTFITNVGAAQSTTAHRRAAVEDYVLTWDGCDKALGDISSESKANIFCDYTIAPIGNKYKVEYLGWSGIKGDACEGLGAVQAGFTDRAALLVPPGTSLLDATTYTATVNDDPQGTNSNHTVVKTNGEFHTDIDIDRSEFLNSGDDETFHFCMRHDVLEDLGDGSFTSLYFMKTFITVKFFLNGSFELNADSDGRVGEDDDVVYTGDDDVLFPNDDGIVGNDDGGDKFNDQLFNDDCDGTKGPCGGGGINVTENLTASEVFDEFNKTYSVFAYQCALEPPHAQVDDIIYQGDNLGVCVETLFKDTFIADVIDLELIQSNGDGVGGRYTTKPVDTNTANVVTEYNCDQPSRIGELKSKCFIKTAMLSQFFITQLIVNATGEVDLKIRLTGTNPTARRLEEYRKLQGGIDGSYTVNTVVGVQEDAELGSVSSTVNNALGSAAMFIMLAVNFL
mmetsp:Transcript_42031/g.49105  ORF Transcript_42031/g.49105 Transcript_42031/m.49105 type:complete len:465 (+) Transcript_42031:108-1502(+)